MILAYLRSRLVSGDLKEGSEVQVSVSFHTKKSAPCESVMVRNAGSLFSNFLQGAVGPDLCGNISEGKGKGKGLDTCYSAAYMSQTSDQQRFTISDVAAEPMVPQRIMWPSIARANGQLDNGAASRHTIAPVSHTRPLSSSRSYYSFPVRLRVGG